MARLRIVGPILMVLTLLGLSSTGKQQVARGESPARAWEESLTIPTYPLGAPDKNPLFVERRTYQGAESPIYPYPMLDALINRRVDKTYKAVYLENEYVRICVLPEIGGRIFAAYDKTNGYDFLYRQHVIKPALVGMVGAWTSGGTEWNIPHHHRATTFMPVDYSLSTEPDGSATVTVGELELRHRMRWVVQLRLRPGSSCVEQTVRLINRTAEENSFLFFANIAVASNENYQVLFPPDVQWVTYHGKHEFSKWPVADSIYHGVDFRGGVDVSWWKNHPSPISMFVMDSDMDFVGGYDHGRRAGMVHVADHHISPGKKFFTWGAGEAGQAWDRALTDEDGPYIELMAGSFSDNQPDYSWIHPYQTKVAETFWYPIAEIGGVKNASREAAVNLEVTAEGVARFGVVVTADHPEVQVELLDGVDVLHEEKVAAGPGRPFCGECRLAGKHDKLTLRVSADGRELVSYTTVERSPVEMPEPVQPPARLDQIATVEEVYHAALRIEQLHSGVLDPEDYYREVLRRDPKHVKANTAMGIRAWQRHELEKAEEYLQKAVSEATDSYLAPKDGEAPYFYGIVLREQGKAKEACDWLNRAAWVAGWESAANYELAEMCCANGEFDEAVVHLDRALEGNSLNLKALTLKAAVLRHLGRKEEAAALLDRAITLDPLDPWPAWERSLALGDPAPRAVDRQALLEPATDYAAAGLWLDAVDVLQSPIAGGADDPLVDYFLGYYLEKLGKVSEAKACYAAAAKGSTDHVFPFRREAFAVLQHVREQNPKDGRAAYYLGNLFMQYRQHDQAIAQWEAARALLPEFSLVHRNLALAYSGKADGLDRAIASMEKARQCEPGDARLLLELDQLCEKAHMAPKKRLALLEKNHEVALKRDDTLAAEIGLLVETGRFEDALQLLKGRQFHVWEGAGRTAVHNSYSKSHLELGRRCFRKEAYEEALKHFEAALEYPPNLASGRPLHGARLPETCYALGKTCEAMGNREGAERYYRQAVETAPANFTAKGAGSVDDPESSFWGACALKRLGRAEDATTVFNNLIAAGEAHMKDHLPLYYFSSFGHPLPESIRFAQAHFGIGLGLLGLEKKSEAQAEFAKAVKLNPNHVAARELAETED